MFKKYKTLFIISILALLICVVPMVNLGNSVSYATDENYEVLYPEMNKYLYLDSPELIAMSGDVVAVYDSSLKKILTAGAEHNEYDVSIDYDDDESVLALTFANDTLYFLTNRNRLHDVFGNSDIDLQSKIALAMCSFENKLYLYNSLISVYEYDGTSFTEYYDKGFKILSSTAFTSTSDKGYFYKDNYIYTLDYMTLTTTKSVCEYDADKLFIRDNKLYLIFEDVIKCLDDGLTTLIFEEVGDVATDGTNTAFLINDSKCIVKCDEDFDVVDLYGCASSLDYWFDNPVSVESFDNIIAVYDKNNSRIEIFDDNGVKNVSLNADFDIFTSDKDYFALAKDSNITIIKEDQITNINTSYDIGAMSLYNNTLYVYDKSSKTIYQGVIGASIEFSRFCYVSTDIDKLITIDENILYAKSNDIIYTLSPIGRGDLFESEKTIISFDVDYIGNIVALESDENGFYIVNYTKSFGGFTKSLETKLNGFAESFLSISLNGTTAYSVDSNKNLLLKIPNIQAETKDTFVPSVEPDTKNIESVTYARSTTGTVVYKYNNNFAVSNDIIDAGSIFTILDEKTDFYFVLTQNGKTGYIEKTNSQIVTPSALSGKVIALFDTIGIYNIPSTELAKVTTYNKDMVFTLVDDCALFKLNGTWVKVKYTEGGEEKVGYALKTRLMTYTEPEIIEDEKTVVKAKSSRVGEKIKGYAMADTTSSEVFSVTDGTKLTVVGTFDENSTFTLVEYNGIQGYVLTANLQENKGLTAGQIAAITISVITVAITGLYIVISRRKRKMNN